MSNNNTAEEQITNKERYELRKRDKNETRNSVSKNKVLKRTLMWVLIGGALTGSVFALYNYEGSPGTTALIVDAVGSTDRVYGLSTSSVVLIEYGDFQCPACAQYEPLVQKIRSEYGEKIAFVYRHFPLGQHKNAKITAYASEVAGKQGKFWEMHDKIYENQGQWASLSNDKVLDVLITYAEFLELDVDLFKIQIESDEIKNKVDSDYQSGVRAGINATPTFILNGKKIQPRSYDEFKQFIEQEISAAANS